MNPWAIGQSLFGQSLKVTLIVLLNVLKFKTMNAQERANVIARIEEVKAALTKATKEDKVTLNAELAELEAKLKADEANKQAPEMPTTIDVNAMSSAAIYELFQPHFTNKKVIGIVEEIRESGKDRTGVVNGYKVKLAVPSESQKDIFGVSKFTLQGYWVNVNSEMAVGQVVAADVSKQVVIIGNKLYEGEMKHPKSLVPIETVMDIEKKQLLTDRYQLRKVKTVLQNTELFTFIDTVIPDEVDGEMAE